MELRGLALGMALALTGCADEPSAPAEGEEIDLESLGPTVTVVDYTNTPAEIDVGGRPYQIVLCAPYSGEQIRCEDRTRNFVVVDGLICEDTTPDVGCTIGVLDQWTYYEVYRW